MTALAVSDALVAALRAAHGAAVWTHSPDNAVPPYTIVGQMVSSPFGGKAGSAEWHVVEIIDFAQGASRAPVQARMAITRATLNRVAIAGAGVATFKPEVLPEAADDIHEDGLTWSGTQRFKILGQPAA